jgi:hypothetical protein
MLTENEKEILRQIICSKPVSATILKSYASKSDDEVRTIISDWKKKQVACLNIQKSLLDQKIKNLS